LGSFGWFDVGSTVFPFRKLTLTYARLLVFLLFCLQVASGLLCVILSGFALTGGQLLFGIFGSIPPLPRSDNSTVRLNALVFLFVSCLAVDIESNSTQVLAHDQPQHTAEVHIGNPCVSQLVKEPSSAFTCPISPKCTFTFFDPAFFAGKVRYYGGKTDGAGCRNRMLSRRRRRIIQLRSMRAKWIRNPRECQCCLVLVQGRTPSCGVG
jgi:hypothetical protein